MLQLDKDELNAGILLEKLSLIVIVRSLSVCALSGGAWLRQGARYWDSRTLACRASQVFLASPNNIAVLGL